MSDLYNGNAPYIFVSYAHKDSDQVLPLVQELTDAGYRVWYDKGIEIGTEWPEYIATKLFHSRCVLAFISPNAVHSKNCRREINFAIDKDKELLSIYLEEFELPLGMQMQLNTLQAFLYTQSNRDAAFLDKLCLTPSIQECLERNTAGKPLCADLQAAPTPTPAPAAPQHEPAAIPSLQSSRSWRCKCGINHTGDVYRCTCGAWRCTCGQVNADYVSSCSCGRSQRDLPQNHAVTESTIKSIPIVLPNWLCICGIHHTDNRRKCTCGAWRCVCGQVNADYITSCSCGLSKRDSFRLK